MKLFYNLLIVYGLYVYAILFQIITVIVYAAKPNVIDKDQYYNKYFSGFYTLQNSQSLAERFAASWLTTRSTFTSDKYIARLRNSPNIETVTLALMDAGIPVMTRDYFDFQVIHLSTTTNQIPSLHDENIQRQLLFQMRKTVEAYQNSTNNAYGQELLKKRLNRPKRLRMINTIVIIPYTSVAGSQHIDIKEQKLIKFSQKLRLYYLQATIYSVSRYFPKIIITTQSHDDMKAVASLNLPIWKLVSLKDDVAGNSKKLPQMSLLYTYKQMMRSNTSNYNNQDDDDWEKIRYVYYTEMDQILHTRILSLLYSILDRVNDNLIMVPHRLNTLALPKTFESEDPWRNSDTNAWNKQKLDDLGKVQVVTEDALLPKGSCCDHGRFLLEHCGRFWTICPNYGIQNHTTWLRFGQYGFTMPAGTGHRAICSYSAEKRICPVPVSCQRHHHTMINDQDFTKSLCGEMERFVIIPEFNRTKRFY